uniref:Reverse transcriptase domain-containing protein n=1 Tax=Tanacetum cinerariifolium TaxID=118510 RepID=A0A699L764_TANCI|nr:reverse transcriptase domain-containing protein [Tanacetum cinerariifolium]
MAPKRTTRSTPAKTTTTTTTSVTNAQLKALIDQGIANALAARDADRSQNGEDSHDSGMGARRQAPPARECTYQYFMKCKLLYFKGTEGVNSYVTTVGPDVVYAMTWTNLRKKMTDKMFPEESDKIERYINGLPDMIYRSVMASKPKTMQNVIEFTTELMDEKINTFAERQAENKGKFEDTSKNNQNQQQNKKQNTGRAYTAGSDEKKPYGGGNGNAPAKVYEMGHTGTNLDSNVITGTFLVNNRYASILFYTGADRSFVSTAFSSQINITPTALNHYYDVELADGVTTMT